MTSQNKDQKQLKGIFPEVSPDELDDGFSAKVDTSFSNSDQLYALSSDDEIVKKFQLILRCGRKVRVPYAVLPIVEISDSKDQISIMAYGLLITIDGKNLGKIEEFLAEESLVWLRESFSKKDDGASEMFISKITIEGKAVSKKVE